MSHFNVDLEDGLPPVTFVLNPANAGRFVTFMAECDLAKKRVAQLENSLRETLIQLEGWVSWKCPKKYLEEHRRFIAEQQAVLKGEASAEAAEPAQPGGLTAEHLRAWRRCNGLDEATGEPA